MSGDIQRVIYYDRELLRGFDFTADQTYHIEMRRRLNLALHLRGIASGLEVMAVADTGGQFCINPGMAIDGYGREVVLFDRYVLSDDDFRAAHIKAKGTYAVCISYDRQPATPPSAGYNACGISGQYTRWVESPTVQILPSKPVPPDVPPLPTDPLPDDPKASPWPIFLGFITLTVALDGTVAITGVATVARQREYVGVRAQRIDAPAAIPPAPAAGPAPDPTVFIDAATPVTVEADLQVEQNLIVGNDFVVDKPKVLNPPSDPTFLGPEGNARVENYLFVQGNIYTAVPPGVNPSAPTGGQWVSLADFVATHVPEIQVKNTVAVDVTGSSPVTFTLAAQKLASVSKADIFVALAGVEWVDYTDVNNWFVKLGSLLPSADIQFNVAAKFLQVTAGTKTSCDFSLSWLFAPSVIVAPATTPLPLVKKLTVNYMVIFYP